MCGRVFIAPSAASERLLADYGLDGAQLPTLPNVAPTEAVPVLHRAEQGYALGPMRWWLHPHWSPDPPNQAFSMFNAKIETVLTSRAFRGPIRHRRGAVLATGFVEWETRSDGKQPYYITTDGVLKLAAIWDCWQDQVWSCSIITQPASDNFKHIHHRMQLSLDNDQLHQWLNPEEDAKQLLRELKGASQPLRICEVGRAVNNARKKIWPEESMDDSGFLSSSKQT